MTVCQQDYRKQGRGHGKALVNVRLRHKRGKTTVGEARAALRSLIRTGTVPKGWQFAAVEWYHPGPRVRRTAEEMREAGVASGEWTEGDIEDFDRFRPMLEHLLDSITVGVVE